MLRGMSLRSARACASGPNVMRDCGGDRSGIGDRRHVSDAGDCLQPGMADQRGEDLRHACRHRWSLDRRAESARDIARARGRAPSKEASNSRRKSSITLPASRLSWPRSAAGLSLPHGGAVPEIDKAAHRGVVRSGVVQSSHLCRHTGDGLEQCAIFAAAVSQDRESGRLVERERPDPIRPGERGGERDRAAERVTDQMKTLGIVPQQRRDELGLVAQRRGPGVHGRRSASGHSRQDRACSRRTRQPRCSTRPRQKPPRHERDLVRIVPRTHAAFPAATRGRRQILKGSAPCGAAAEGGKDAGCSQGRPFFSPQWPIQLWLNNFVSSSLWFWAIDREAAVAERRRPVNETGGTTALRARIVAIGFLANVAAVAPAWSEQAQIQRQISGVDTGGDAALRRRSRKAAERSVRQAGAAQGRVSRNRRRRPGGARQAEEAGRAAGAGELLHQRKRAHPGRRRERRPQTRVSHRHHAIGCGEFQHRHDERAGGRPGGPARADRLGHQQEGVQLLSPRGRGAVGVARRLARCAARGVDRAGVLRVPRSRRPGDEGIAAALEQLAQPGGFDPARSDPGYGDPRQRAVRRQAPRRGARTQRPGLGVAGDLGARRREGDGQEAARGAKTGARPVRDHDGEPDDEQFAQRCDRDHAARPADALLHQFGPAEHGAESEDPAVQRQDPPRSLSGGDRQVQFPARAGRLRAQGRHALRVPRFRSPRWRRRRCCSSWSPRTS